MSCISDVQSSMSENVQGHITRQNVNKERKICHGTWTLDVDHANEVCIPSKTVKAANFVTQTNQQVCQPHDTFACRASVSVYSQLQNVRIVYLPQRNSYNNIVNVKFTRWWSGINWKCLIKEQTDGRTWNKMNVIILPKSINVTASRCRWVSSFKDMASSSPSILNTLHTSVTMSLTTFDLWHCLVVKD